MSISRRKTLAQAIRCEYYRIDKVYLIAIPLILLFIGILTRWICGSPLATLHYIGAVGTVPPMWVMILLFSAFYFIAGLALGVALGNRFCACGERKYQGAMWFCISLAIGYAWYPVFFCARLFLISLLMCALCLFAGICATVCFAQVSGISLCFSIIYDSWLLYLTFLNMQMFFAI